MGRLKGGHSCDLQTDDRKDFVLPGDKDKHEDRAHYSQSACDETPLMATRPGLASFSVNVIWTESHCSTLTATW